jgi:hypothetical protein
MPATIDDPAILDEISGALRFAGLVHSSDSNTNDTNSMAGDIMAIPKGRMVMLSN